MYFVLVFFLTILLDVLIEVGMAVNSWVYCSALISISKQHVRLNPIDETIGKGKSIIVI